jgi:hypothetical protein
LTPVRLLATIINKSLQAHTYLTKAEEKTFSNQLYELSMEREPVDFDPSQHHVVMSEHSNNAEDQQAEYDDGDAGHDYDD